MVQHAPHTTEVTPGTSIDRETEERVSVTNRSRWPLSAQQGPLANLVTARSTTSRQMRIGISEDQFGRASAIAIKALKQAQNRFRRDCEVVTHSC